MRQNFSLFHQARMELEAKFAFGQSKHEAKKDGSNVNYIYSYSTAKGYYQVAREYTTWCKDTYGTKKLVDARDHVGEYLQKRISEGKSACTVRHDAAALAKIYGCKQSDFCIELPKRHRANIIRSRIEENSNTKNYSKEKNKDIEEFSLSTGLRRHELKNLNTYNIVIQGDKVYVNVINGKGGKNRIVEALNPNAVIKIYDDAQNRSSTRLFESVPSHMDVHANRAKFADELYKRVARDITTLPEKELYRCRKDKYGIVYDREAMKVVSEALGHNRIDVIAQSYLNNQVK